MLKVLALLIAFLALAACGRGDIGSEGYVPEPVACDCPCDHDEDGACCEAGVCCADGCTSSCDCECCQDIDTAGDDDGDHDGGDGADDGGCDGGSCPVEEGL